MSRLFHSWAKLITIFYHRRLSILSSLMNPPQAKSISKNKAAILQSQDADYL